MFVANAPTFDSNSYVSGNSNIPDTTGANVNVGQIAFTDVDNGDAMTLSMTDNYFTFRDNLDGTGKSCSCICIRRVLQ